MKNIVYFDYAAATPVSPATLRAMRPYADELFYNPSGLSLASRQIRSDIKNARENVAKWLGAQPSEIIFTAGGTEANNLAINGMMQNYPNAHIVASSIEHDSVLEPIKAHNFTLLAVNNEGIINTEKLAASITDTTVLVSVMYVNNEIGSIQPLRKVSQIIKKIRAQRQAQGNNTPLYFHSDACQAANYLDLHVDKIGLDMMTLNAGKIYGPKQMGCLYVRKNVNLQPIILGGGQERGLRSGTENVANIVGFAAALNDAQLHAQKEARRLSELQVLFLNAAEVALPGVVINGSLKHRIANSMHITIPGIDNERVLMELDERGIIGASGSACSARKDDVSHVLSAIGLSDQQARSSLRFSMGRQTTHRHVLGLVDALVDIIK